MKKEDMKNILKKFTSRKFVAAMIPLIICVITMLIGHEYEVTVICSAAGMIIPAVAYIITEGRLDSKAMKTITDTASDAASQLGASQVAAIIKQTGAVAEALSDDDSECESNGEADKEDEEVE